MVDNTLYEIAERELNGDTFADIARQLGKAITTITYHRSKPEYNEVLEQLKRDRDSRANETAAERVTRLLDDMAMTLESLIEEEKEPKRKLLYISQLKDLAGITGTVETSKGKLNIVEVPAMLSIEAFNAGKINNGSCTQEGIPTPTQPQNPSNFFSNPGGDETPGPVQKSQNENEPTEEPELPDPPEKGVEKYSWGEVEIARPN